MNNPDDAFLKLRCDSCGGSIEFPAHALGQQIECPHCNLPLVLKKRSFLNWKAEGRALSKVIGVVVTVIGMSIGKVVVDEIWKKPKPSAIVLLCYIPCVIGAALLVLFLVIPRKKKKP